MAIPPLVTRHSSLITHHSHRGQVALYLIAVLVAICVLTMMNVGIYLSVSAKNKAMNAGDAAALAVAQHQGSLLNSIGQMNIDHLKAALEGDDEQCQAIMTNQLRTCFLGPIDALAVNRGGYSYIYGCISAGNKWAKENGIERNGEMESELRKIARVIREIYAADPIKYPEPWEGAWMEYAQQLENAVSAGIWACPDNICLIGTRCNHFLLNPSFYDAVCGDAYCWFKFNAPGLAESYNDFRDWSPLPEADDVDVRLQTVNSLIYSLHLEPKVGSAVQLFGANLICRLADATEDEVANSRLLKDPAQQWMFYDMSAWRKWWEIDPYGENHFPVVGPVKQEYDVRGCAAVCRVYKETSNLFADGESDEVTWSAAAKPFGTVEDEDGDVADVTALYGLVLPSFNTVRLVPVSAISGGCGELPDTGNPHWLRHVGEHLPKYLQSGNLLSAWSGGCYYCKMLAKWEKESFRRSIARKIKYDSDSCVRPLPGLGSNTGGAPYAR